MTKQEKDQRIKELEEKNHKMWLQIQADDHDIFELKQQLYEQPKKICGEIINHIKPLRDLEITAIRESREYDFINEKARLNWIGTRKEISQNYNDLMKFVGEIQAKYEKENK